MMPPVSPMLQRILAVAILLGMVGTAWFGLAVPIIDAWRFQRDDLAQAMRLLASYRNEAAARAGLETQLKELKQRESTSSAFLEGGNFELVAAHLQTEIRRAVEAGGGQVVSAQILRSEDERGVDKVIVRVDFRISTDGLPQVAYRLETVRPMLFIDNVAIQAPENAAQSRTNSDLRDLGVRWDVYGYMRGHQS